MRDDLGFFLIVFHHCFQQMVRKCTRFNKLLHQGCFTKCKWFKYARCFTNGEG